MKAGRGEKASEAATLMVFCIFAMLVFTVLLLGAGAYKNIVGASRDGSDERVCLSYVWTTVKNNDDADSLHVGTFNDVSALYIDEKIGDSVYNTIIYHHEGWVYELFAEAGYDFPLGEGARVIQAESLQFVNQSDGNILAVSGKTSVFFAARGETSIPIESRW